MQAFGYPLYIKIQFLKFETNLNKVYTSIIASNSNKEV